MGLEPSTRSVIAFGSYTTAHKVTAYLTNDQAYGLIALSKVIDDGALLSAILCSVNCHIDEADSIAPAIKALAADLKAQGWTS